MSTIQRTNDLGQPIGFAVPDFQGAQRPSGVTLEGRYVLTGTVEDDRIEGSADIGQTKPVPWCGERTR